MEDRKKTKSVGKYEIVSRIAQGGMGTVYKAKHPTLGRYVLLKRLTLRGGAQFTERFKREATLLMDFKHEHIVHVYDHFKEGSYYYIVEEFVDGISLEGLLRKERYLSNAAAILILYEVAKALKYAHDKGVVHRDIKPGNILISQKGEVKLVDFGIATSVERPEEGLTRDGMTLGTPAYIPPEQIGDARNVDKRADIYSFGVVLYEVVTGKTPFPASFTADTITLIQKGRYLPAARLNPRTSPLLRRIIRRCIRPNRRRRFQDLQPVIRMLGRRIRGRDPAIVREAIRRMLKGQKFDDVMRTRLSAPVRWAAAVVLAALLAAGAITAYRHGYAYELLLADRYGALVAAVRVPPGYKDPDEVMAQAVLYREKGSELERWAGDPLVFRPAQDVKPGAGFTLETSRVYLPEGRYRLKLSADGELTWTSFFLEPRLEQKKHFDTVAARRIEVDLSTDVSLPLDVRFAVRDIRSGDDLTASTEVSFQRGSEWVPLTPATEGLLRTGTTYRLRFDRRGYLSQYYNLLVRPYEALLRLDVALVPVPGTLQVSSDTDGVTLLLDGSRQYLSGGADRATRELAPLGRGTRDLVLDPGSYSLAAHRGALARSLDVTVSSDRTTRVVIELDRKSHSLVLRSEP